MLNALRHQRFGTGGGGTVNGKTPEFFVLNALRHQRFGTPLNPPPPQTGFSAQRLTASEVWHRQRERLNSPNSRCSTPYGIRGLAPRQSCDRSSRDRCAQRLTASEVWHAGSSNNRIAMEGRCSTPYGIRGLAPCAFVSSISISSTCSTPYGIRGLAQSPLDSPLTKGVAPVLNALRHQRFGTDY